MIAYFDTSSLLCLVRNFHHFDPEFWDKWLRDRIEEKEIRVLPEVLKECERVSGGLVCKTLPWLDKKIVYKITDENIATVLIPKFYKQVDEHFIRKEYIRLKGLTQTEIESLKEKWIGDADGQLIIAAKAHKDCCVVTEESESSNDGKEFKKIPVIVRGSYIDGTCLTLAAYLNQNGLSISFNQGS